MFVGNDIIDIGVAEENHPRFANRVMSDLEFEIFQRNDSDPLMLCQMWAAKEAAYKLEKQRNPSIFFSPQNFIVDLNAQTVSFQGKVHALQYSKSDDYVFCCCSEGVNQVVNRVEECDEFLQSKVVRLIAAREISVALQIPLEQVEIVSDELRIPSAFSRSGKIPVSLSMTHHGRFAAVSIGIG